MVRTKPECHNLKYPNVVHLTLINFLCDIQWFCANCCLALCRPYRCGTSPFLHWRRCDTYLPISAPFLVEISVRSPRKTNYFHYHTKMFSGSNYTKKKPFSLILKREALLPVLSFSTHCAAWWSMSDTLSLFLINQRTCSSAYTYVHVMQPPCLCLLLTLVSFQPKYRLGHPVNYLFSSSEKKNVDESILWIVYLILKTEALPTCHRVHLSYWLLNWLVQ